MRTLLRDCSPPRCLGALFCWFLHTYHQLTPTHTHCQEPPHPWPGGEAHHPIPGRQVTAPGQCNLRTWICWVPGSGVDTASPGQEGCCQALIPEAAWHKANPPMPLLGPLGVKGSQGHGVGQGWSQVGPGVEILPQGGWRQDQCSLQAPHRFQGPSGLLSQRARRRHY